MKWLLAMVAAVTLTRAAAAEPVVQIRNNGPVDNRLNMVILGDGYRANELVKYATDVDLLLAQFFQQSPYAEYQSYFNVFRVDVTSNESGADHPERGQARDTALGATYDCGGIQRTICVNTTLVNTVVNRSVAPNARDLVMVLVNDAEYGGSGGAVVVGSTGPQVVELMLHEAGHTLGLLADEYTDQPPTCFNSAEPPEGNATRASTRESTKWNVWIAATTPVPTTSTQAGVPGLYQGAKYCPTGLYRPTFNSKMRSLGQPFEAINDEQLVLRMYNFVSPIDAVSPDVSEVVITPTDHVTFAVSGPAGGTLRVRWKIDGADFDTGSTLSVTSSRLPAGRHRLQAEVSDTTTLVRKDTAGVLVARHDWDIVVFTAWGRSPQ